MSLDNIGEFYRALIASDRVSGTTRALLETRAKPDDPAYGPVAMGANELATLRAVAGRVIPQQGATIIDLGARIDAMLSEGTGDGWRFAKLPPDAEAYRAGLRTIEAAAVARHARCFTVLEDSAKDLLLKAVASAEIMPEGRGLLDGPCMALWFEDVRSDLVRLFVSHPATLERLGYSGIAYGGDDVLSGFSLVGAGETQAWEPVAARP